MLDYEKVCTNAIQVVGKYLAFTEDAGLSDELREAYYAVSDAWDDAESHKAGRMCSIAWHACNAAKKGDRRLARIHVSDFWSFMYRWPVYN